MVRETTTLHCRTSDWQGPLQVLPLGSGDGGKAYFFSGYIKVLNTVNAQKVTVTLSYKTTGKSTGNTA